MRRRLFADGVAPCAKIRGPKMPRLYLSRHRSIVCEHPSCLAKVTTVSSQFCFPKAEKKNGLLVPYKQPAYRRIQTIMPIPLEHPEAPYATQSSNTPKTPVMHERAHESTPSPCVAYPTEYVRVS
jgi:hypothetical protein